MEARPRRYFARSAGRAPPIFESRDPDGRGVAAVSTSNLDAKPQAARRARRVTQAGARRVLVTSAWANSKGPVLMTDEKPSKLSAISRTAKRYYPRFVETYCTFDPRSLGLGRIALGALLLYDLLRRVPGIATWYSNEGLLPNHTILWRPSSDYVFSFLLAASRPQEAAALFALFGLIYFAFTIGWHTRLFHVLSFVCLVSLHDRVIFLENGGDVALNLLCAWTLFLPMGRRFSIDAVRRALRAHREVTVGALNERAPNDTRPIASIAVLAILLEISVIYYFNAVNKHGWTWRRGLAVYYVLYQERMVTWFGLVLRSLMTVKLSRVLSYAVLAIEYAAPVLLLSPFGRLRLRRLAIFLFPALHVAFAAGLNLGQFSFNMIGYFPLLLSAEDWALLGQRLAPKASRSRTVYVSEDNGLAWGGARLLSRLDAFGRLHFVSARELGGAPPLWAVDDPITGRRVTGAAALAECLAALPCGLPLAVAVRAPISRTIVDLTGRLVAKNQGWIAGALHLAPLGGSPSDAEPPTPARRWFAKRARQLGEFAAVVLLVAVTSQLLVENRAIPQRYKLPQPKWITALVVYPRLLQGWQMFSADVPTSERMLYVDAVTFGGRHVDPFNEAASRVADLPVQKIPPHMEQNEFWCDYTNRIPENQSYWRAFKEWIFDYHRRTGRPEDRIISFEARLLEHDEPAPGEVGPKNIRSKVIMNERE